MRKLKMMEHMSLDGVIQHSADDDGFAYADWSAPYRTAAGREMVMAAQGAEFDLLLGRRTYDLWAGHWAAAPSSPMADSINTAKKYVATHRPESLAWGPAEGVGADVVEGVRRIKAAAGPDLVLWGSSTLTSVLMAAGLVDEVTLMVYPLLLGAGKRFFAEGTAGRGLELVSATALASGIVVCGYKVGAAL